MSCLVCSLSDDSSCASSASWLSDCLVSRRKWKWPLAIESGWQPPPKCAWLSPEAQDILLDHLLVPARAVRHVERAVLQRTGGGRALSALLHSQQLQELGARVLRGKVRAVDACPAMQMRLTTHCAASAKSAILSLLPDTSMRVSSLVADHLRCIASWLRVPWSVRRGTSSGSE